MTILARAFALVVTATVALALAAGGLVTASYFIAMHQLQGFLSLHLVVGGVFVLLGLLVGAIGVQVYCLAMIVVTLKTSQAGALGARVFRLLVLLGVAVLGLCVTLAAATFGILERIGQGAAVFG